MGSHQLKVGDWEQTLVIESNQTQQIIAENKNTIKDNTLVYKAKDLPNHLFDGRNNKYYKTVKIGKQVWMAENLAFNYGSGSWVYDNNQSNVTKYGCLYNWETAKNICPNGWHLPSQDEFKTLLNNVGGSGSVAAYHALLPSGSSGFSSSLGGYRYSDGNFYYIGVNAFFWTSSAYMESNAWIMSIHLKSTSHFEQERADLETFINKSCGFSVRCLQNN